MPNNALAPALSRLMATRQRRTMYSSAMSINKQTKRLKAIVTGIANHLLAKAGRQSMYQIRGGLTSSMST